MSLTALRRAYMTVARALYEARPETELSWDGVREIPFDEANTTEVRLLAKIVVRRLAKAGLLRDPG